MQLQLLSYRLLAVEVVVEEGHMANAVCTLYFKYTQS